MLVAASDGMSKPVRLLDAATSDATTIAGWYDDHQWGVGDRFLAELRRTLDSIAMLPDSFELVHRRYHRASVRDFPYSVYFRELDDEILVHCVIHNARHPNVWHSRLP